MKKLVLAMVAVCAAVVANASAVQWNVNSKMGTTGGIVPGATAYLVLATDWSGLTKITLANVTGIAKDSAEVLANGTTKVNVGATARTVNGFTKAVSTTDNFYVCFVNEAGTSYYLSPSMTGTYYDPTDALTPPPTAMSAKVTTAVGAANMTKFDNVPEPTSGLLLLIGMAGLALRRRRA